MHQRPIVLFIGGHDPTGGAGLQADIETAQAHGCRAVTLVTCLTAQDTTGVHRLHPQPVEALTAQLRLLLADLRPQAVKIGLLGQAALIEALAGPLGELAVPRVVDPVLAAGGGQHLSGEREVAALRRHLLPGTTLLTPNRAEARRLAMEAEPERAARRLLGRGVEAVLLTGADEARESPVVNRLFLKDREHRYEWPLLARTVHGSGCTLAAACACRLARGEPIEQAVERAQEWTWRALERAERPGKGQWLPDRGEPAP